MEAVIMNAVKRKLYGAMALILVTALILSITACANGTEPTTDVGGAVAQTEPTTATPTPAVVAEDVTRDFEVAAAVDALADLRELEARFPRYYNNPGQIIQGGDFVWALGMTATITGIFHPTLSTMATDRDIWTMILYRLLPEYDSGRIMLGPNGHNAPAYLEVDVDNMTATITMRDGVYIYWQDGVLLTLDDLVYAYEFTSHPDYTGLRFGPGNGTSLVVGVDEFRSGERGYISGLVLREDKRQLTIHYTEMPPGLLFEILAYPVPRHHFEGIAVGDTAGHINARDNMLGFGPFYIQTVVPGESVVLGANENYWRGRPNLDRVIFTRVDPEFGAEGARIGQFDRIGFRLIDWPYHYDMNNMQFLGRIGNGLGPLIYFSLGEMRDDGYGNRYIVPRDDGHPITHPAMRRAIAYAIDRLAIDVNFNNGFGRPATSILTPFNAAEWICPYSPGLSVFDLERANQLLDEAGFVMGPNGFRLDLEGNPFHINYGMAFSATNEVIFPMHQQNFRAIGLDVRLFEDNWYDPNWRSVYARSVHGVDPDARCRNTDLHMFQGSWSQSANPSPVALWGNDQAFNFSRFTTPQWQAIIDDIGSTAAWCPEFLGDAIRAYAALFDYYVPAITASWSVGITLVNNRVANFSLERSRHLDDSLQWHLVGLTAETPYAHR